MRLSALPSIYTILRPTPSESRAAILSISIRRQFRILSSRTAAPTDHIRIRNNLHLQLSDSSLFPRRAPTTKTMPAPPASARSPSPHPTTLSLPRILCLHGGGTNASIFHNQLRSFLSHPNLSPRFRFVFADAPFECDEGIGVYPVYADWGPYRRWFRWMPNHDAVDVGAAHHEIEYVLQRAMEMDEGTGEWVGVLGFSQGAKLGCSMLYQQQLSGKASPWNFRFGIIMAGRCPFAALSAEGEELPWLQSAGGLPNQADMDAIQERPDMRLQIPTIHVHGLKDEGLELHRRCVNEYCAPGTTTVVEWDGPHRVPIKRADVEKVVEAIVGVADEYGA